MELMYSSPPSGEQVESPDGNSYKLMMNTSALVLNAKLPITRQPLVRYGFFLALALFAGCLHHQQADPPSARQGIVYPTTETVDQVDLYHGHRIPDPYRWLEDPDAPKTKAWVDSQNQVTFGFLGQIPARSRIRDRLTKLWDHERYGVPFKQGQRYFLSKNDGLQNQNVLYTLDSLDGPPVLLLDPNRLSADGTVALQNYRVSEDGTSLAYGLSTAGSDWQEWRVRRVENQTDTEDLLKWVKFSSVSWTHDGRGFFYSRYDEPARSNELRGVNYYHKLYYHRLGTEQSKDELVYHRPDQKEWGFGGYVTEDGRYLIISVSHGTDPKNRVFYKDLQAGESKVVELLNDFDAAYDFIGNDQNVFWFHTDLHAPRGRVIAIDITHPARAEWKELIPQTVDTLTSVSLVHDQFIALYLKDAQTRVETFNLHGSPLAPVELPGLGTALGFGGKRADDQTFYAFTSFNVPMAIYRYDLKTRQSHLFRKPQLDFQSENYETKQVFYSSKDGTRIPMFIAHKKGLQLHGNNPTYLYGYGGFNISLKPGFSVSSAVWMEMGGVYAMPNLRGGGEYGEEWHQAGTKLKKQNVFDDFMAAAEWLVAHHYTRPDKLAIGGGSNGGLLVGACLTQRPDLFGAALPDVGVLDMLRFNKFTIGWAWTSDYGSPEDPIEFEALYRYSPLHNLKKGRAYPATLITTADHDDRVVPAHSFKFAAALQAAQAGPAPVIIRVQTRAGHGAGKPTTKLIEEAADRWAFLVRTLKMEEGVRD